MSIKAAVINLKGHPVALSSRPPAAIHCSRLSDQVSRECQRDSVQGDLLVSVKIIVPCKSLSKVHGTVADFQSQNLSKFQVIRNWLNNWMLQKPIRHNIIGTSCMGIPYILSFSIASAAKFIPNRHALCARVCMTVAAAFRNQLVRRGRKEEGVKVPI